MADKKNDVALFQTDVGDYNLDILYRVFDSNIDKYAQFKLKQQPGNDALIKRRRVAPYDVSAFKEAASQVKEAIKDGTLQRTPRGYNMDSSNPYVQDALDLLDKSINALKPYEPEPEEPLKKLDNNIIFNTFNNLGFGGNWLGTAQDLQSFLDLDAKIDDKGTRNISNRAAFLNKVLSAVIEDVNSHDYDYSDSPFKDRDDLVNRAHEAMLQLNQGESTPELMHRLASLGFGSAGALLLGNGDATSPTSTSDGNGEQPEQQSALQQQLDAYKKNLDDAVKAGVLSEADAQEAYNKYVQQLRDSMFLTLNNGATLDEVTRNNWMNQNWTKTGQETTQSLGTIDFSPYADKLFGKNGDSEVDGTDPFFANKDNSNYAMNLYNKAINGQLIDLNGTKNNIPNNVILGALMALLISIGYQDLTQGDAAGVFYIKPTLSVTSGTIMGYNMTTNTFFRLHVDPYNTPILYQMLYPRINDELGLNHGMRWGTPGAGYTATSTPTADATASQQGGTAIDTATLVAALSAPQQLTTGLQLQVQTAKNGGVLTGRMVLKALTGAEILSMGQQQKEALKQQRYAKYQEEATARGMAFEDVLKGKQSSKEDKSNASLLRNVGTGFDVVGAAASFIPIVGNIVGGITGLIGTGLNLVADATDDTVSSSEMWTNLGINAGLTALCLIPGGGAGKVAKAGVKGAKAAKEIGMGMKALKVVKGVVTVGMPAYAGIKVVGNIDRIKELRAKADAGTLSVDERKELDSYYSMAAGAVTGSKALAAKAAPHFGNTTTGKALAWWADPVTGTAAAFGNRKATIAFKDLTTPTAPALNKGQTIKKYGNEWWVPVVDEATGEHTEIQIKNKAVFDKLQSTWEKAAKENVSASEMQTKLLKAYAEATKNEVTVKKIVKDWQMDNEKAKNVFYTTTEGDLFDIKFVKDDKGFKAIITDPKDKGKVLEFDVNAKDTAELRKAFEEGYNSAEIPEGTSKEDAVQIRITKGLEKARAKYVNNELENFKGTVEEAIANGDAEGKLFDLQGYELSGKLKQAGKKLNPWSKELAFPGEERSVLESETEIPESPSRWDAGTKEGKARLIQAAKMHKHGMDFLKETGIFRPLADLDNVAPGLLTTNAEFAHGIAFNRGRTGKTGDALLKRQQSEDSRAVTLMRRMFPEDTAGQTDKDILAALHGLGENKGVRAELKRLPLFANASDEALKGATPLEIAKALATDQVVKEGNNTVYEALTERHAFMTGGREVGVADRYQPAYKHEGLLAVLERLNRADEHPATETTSAQTATASLSETTTEKIDKTILSESTENASTKGEEATTKGAENVSKKSETVSENAKTLVNYEANGTSDSDKLKVVRLGRGKDHKLTAESKAMLDEARHNGEFKRVSRAKVDPNIIRKRLLELGLSDDLIKVLKSNGGIKDSWQVVDKDSGKRTVFIARKGAELKALRNFTLGGSDSSDGLPLFRTGGIPMYRGGTPGTRHTSTSRSRSTSSRTRRTASSSTSAAINPITGDLNTGIGLAHGEDTWHNDIFSVYENDIIDQLQKYGDKYMDWLNTMLDRHYKMYTDAERGGHNSWRRNSFVYSDGNRDIYNYQTDYNTYNVDNGLYGGYNSGRNGDGTLGAIQKATSNNRYIFGANGHTTDHAEGLFAADGRYSLETDDRRVLGRITTDGDKKYDDWTDDLKKEFNDKLAKLGYTMELDSKTNYYKIKKLSKETPVKAETPTTITTTTPEVENPTGTLTTGIKIIDDDLAGRHHKLDKKTVSNAIGKAMRRLNNDLPDIVNYRLSLRNILNQLNLLPKVHLHNPIVGHRYVFDDLPLELQALNQAAQLMSTALNYQANLADLKAAAILEAAYKGDALKAAAREKSLDAFLKSNEALMQLDNSVYLKNYSIFDTNGDLINAAENVAINAQKDALNALTTNNMNFITGQATKRNAQYQRETMAKAQALARNMLAELTKTLATDETYHAKVKEREALATLWLKLYKEAIAANDSQKLSDANAMKALLLDKQEELTNYLTSCKLAIYDKYDHIYFDAILDLDYPVWPDYSSYVTPSTYTVNTSAVDASALNPYYSSLDNYGYTYGVFKNGGRFANKYKKGASITDNFNEASAKELREIRKQVENTIRDYKDASRKLSNETMLALKKIFS